MSTNFYRNFSILRKKKGLTQEEIAQDLGVSRSAVAKWESGASSPNIELVESIAIYFDVTFDELLCKKMAPLSKITMKHLSAQMRELLSEIRKNNNNNLYQVYCTHSVRPFEDEDMANAYFDWGCSEIEKGNYDKAIEYFEEAVTRGDVRSIDALMDTYKEIADILETQEDINLYWKYKLQMARKMQECGKILEDEITSGRVF